MVRKINPKSRSSKSSQVKPNKSVELEWDDGGLDSRLYTEEFWQDDKIIEELGLSSVLAENPQATKLYQEAADVVNANSENRGPLLSALPEPLKSDVKNFALSVDIFKAISKAAVDLAKKAWANVIGVLGKVIKTIGKYLRSKKIEAKGDELIQISTKKLASLPTVGHPIKALVDKRKYASRSMKR